MYCRHYKYISIFLFHDEYTRQCIDTYIDMELFIDDVMHREREGGRHRVMFDDEGGVRQTNILQCKMGGGYGPKGLEER